MVINTPGGGISPDILTTLNDIIIRNGTEPVRAPGLLRAIGVRANTFSRNSGGMQWVSGIGFQASAVIFAACDQNPGNQNWSMGFDQTNAGKCIYFYTNGVNIAFSTTQSIWIERGAGNSLTGQIVATDADRFAISWVLTGACAVDVAYLALP